MHIFHIFLLLTFTFSISSNAQDSLSLPIATIDEILPGPEKTDPFDPAILIPTGIYKGRLVNTQASRPIEFLPRTKEVYDLFGADLQSHILVANFTHDPGSEITHWIAKIPRHAVQSAYWLKNTFSEQDDISEVDAETLAHSQLVYKLSSPVELLVDQSQLEMKEKNYPEIAQLIRMQPITLDSITASFEAMFRFAENPLPFFDKDLWILRPAVPSATRIMSWHTRQTEIIEQTGSFEKYLKTIIYYPLSSTALDLNKLLNSSLEDSAQSGFSEFYHLFTNSCNIRALKWIDTTFGATPNDEEYFQYFSKPDNLEKLLEEIQKTLQLEPNALENATNSSVKQAGEMLLKLGPQKTAKLLLSDTKYQRLLKTLLSYKVIRAIPSTIKEQLDLRGILLEESNPVVP